jgi:hypothetical protein
MELTGTIEVINLNIGSEREIVIVSEYNLLIKQNKEK